MTTPTPAALKARLDAKKASESSTKESSEASRSSQKGRDSRGARSNSRTSRPKRSTSSQVDSRTTSPEDSATTENSPQKASRNSAPSKKDFVRPDHLIQRPLLNHEGLQALKNQMNASSRDAGYKEFEGRDRTNSKQSKNNKENN